MIYEFNDVTIAEMHEMLLVNHR